MPRNRLLVTSNTSGISVFDKTTESFRCTSEKGANDILRKRPKFCIRNKVKFDIVTGATFYDQSGTGYLLI